MFRIPAVYKFEMSTKEATEVLTRYGLGDMLKAMELMDKNWNNHCAGTGAILFDSDSDFYEYYEAEVNAYNVIYAEMKPLFV